MGLPDTSPVPKKDWMGMDYIPVYESEEQDDGKTVKLSLDKVQRSGVRTEAAEARVIVRPVRAVGTVMHDETRLTIVAMRSDAYIEELFVNKTGQHVHVGDPLFRVYSPDIVSAQVDLRNGGAEQRLRNLGVSESHIREVRAGKNPMSLVWPAPATGDVIEKRVINGQRVKAGGELYRIADHTHLWVIADVAESDLSAIKIGTRATVTVRATMKRFACGGQEIDVHHAPEQPAKEASELEPAELHHRGLAADGDEIAQVAGCRVDPSPQRCRTQAPMSANIASYSSWKRSGKAPTCSAKQSLQ